MFGEGPPPLEWLLLIDEEDTSGDLLTLLLLPPPAILEAGVTGALVGGGFLPGHEHMPWRMHRRTVIRTATTRMIRTTTKPTVVATVFCTVPPSPESSVVDEEGSVVPVAPPGPLSPNRKQDKQKPS